MLTTQKIAAFLGIILLSCTGSQRAVSLPKTQRPIHQKFSGLWVAEWSPDDKTIALGGDDSILYFLDTDSFLIQDSLPMGGMIRNASWHPGGRILAVAMNERLVLVDMQTKKIKPLPGFSTGGRGLGWNNTGELVALADGRGMLQIIRKDGSLVRSITKHNNHSYLSLHWHPSGTKILTASDEIILFDTSGRQLKLLQHRKEPTGVLAVRWHPSGTYFVSGDYGHDAEGIPSLLQFWNEEGSLQRQVLGSKGEYRNIRWRPDGKVLATASDALRLWSAQGKFLHETAVPHTLWAVAWDRKGERILTASFDGDVDVWSSEGRHMRQVASSAAAATQKKSQ